MALRLFEQTLANVAADLRRLYLPDSEHGYRLDLSDLDEFVHGLKSALRKQRDENKELRAKYGLPDAAEALAPFGVMPRANASKALPDVRSGLLPRRDAARGDGVN
jgi:hypothetical protein